MNNVLKDRIDWKFWFCVLLFFSIIFLLCHVTNSNIHKQPYISTYRISDENGSAFSYDCSTKILCEDGISVEKYDFGFSGCHQVVYFCLGLIKNSYGYTRCSGEGKYCIIQEKRYR